MIFNRNQFCAVVVFAALSMPLPSLASLVLYTTEADFLAAVSNVGTDTFDDLTDGSLASPVSRAAGAYTYTASAGGGLFVLAPSSSERWLSTENQSDTITFNGFSNLVYWIGGYFFSTATDGSLNSRDVTIVASDGSAITEHLTSTTDTSFRGFVSNNPIASLTITADFDINNPNSDASFSTVNDLLLGGPVVPAPEPGTLPLLALAAAGVVAATRRRYSPA